MIAPVKHNCLTDQPTFSEEEFDNLVSNDLYQKGYFIVHQAIVAKLGFDLAAFFHGLIRFHASVKSKPGYKWNDGWFFYSVEQMKNNYLVPGLYSDTGKPVSRLPEAKQTRWLNALAEHTDQNGSPIEVSRKGWKARRHIRVNTRWVIATIQEWQDFNEKLNLNGFGKKTKNDKVVSNKKNRKGRDCANNRNKHESDKDEASSGSKANGMSTHPNGGGTNTTTSNGVQTLSKQSSSHHKNDGSCQIKNDGSHIKKEDRARKEKDGSPNGLPSKKPHQSVTSNTLEVSNKSKDQGRRIYAKLVEVDDDLLYGRKLSNGFYRRPVNADRCAIILENIRRTRKVTDEQIELVVKYIESDYTGMFFKRFRKIEDLEDSWSYYIRRAEAWQLESKMKKRGGNKSSGGLTDDEARNVKPSTDDWFKLSPEQKKRKRKVSIVKNRAVCFARERLGDPDYAVGSLDIRQVDVDAALEDLGLPKGFTDLSEVVTTGDAGFML